eukprot:192623-Alexandrium_andersonii.AAC.1
MADWSGVCAPARAVQRDQQHAFWQACEGRLAEGHVGEQVDALAHRATGALLQERGRTHLSLL